MPFTFKLDSVSHDLKIRKGRLERVSGYSEVCQKVKVALYHEYGEYFLNVKSGIPWRSSILGYKIDQNTLYNIIQNAVWDVEGVLSVESISITRKSRNWMINIRIRAKLGNNEISPDVFDINNIILEG